MPPDTNANCKFMVGTCNDVAVKAMSPTTCSGRYYNGKDLHVNCKYMIGNCDVAAVKAMCPTTCLNVCVVAPGTNVNNGDGGVTCRGRVCQTTGCSPVPSQEFA